MKWELLLCLAYNHNADIQRRKFRLLTYDTNIFTSQSYYTNFKKLGYLIMSLPILSLILSHFEFWMLLLLRNGAVPHHMALIMDGNRRFAKSINHKVKVGHNLGSLTLLKTIYFARIIGVKTLSVYAFSIENYGRTQEEVDTLMQMLVQKFAEFNKKANSNRLKDRFYKGCEVKIIGDMSYFSDELKAKINEASTKYHSDITEFTLFVCCPYTSRNDIYNSMKKTIQLVNDTHANLDAISVETLTSNMFLEESSNKCDLLVRTSGHVRLSDYMTWQINENGSLVFINDLWPNFGFSEFWCTIFKYGFYEKIAKWNKANPRNINGLKSDKPTLKSKSHYYCYYLLLRLQQMLSKTVFYNTYTNYTRSTYHDAKTNVVSVHDLPDHPLALSVIDRTG